MSLFSQQGGDRRGARQGVNYEKEANKRKEAALTLRKKQKEAVLREKRRKDVDEDSDMQQEANTEKEMEILVASLPELVRQLDEGDLAQMEQATRTIRKLLSKYENPPIDSVIQANCVPRLVRLLESDIPELQFEAAWSLTNIASGTSDHTLTVIQEGACPIFIRLLSSPNENVQEQSVWALGNIAGDSAKFRNFILANGILEPLLNIIHSNPKRETLRHATWCLSNLFRGKPLKSLERVSVAFPTLATLVNHNDEDVITDSCWTLSYITDGREEGVDAVLKMNILPRLVSLLGCSEHTLVNPALRTLGNIVTGTDEQTQQAIDAGLLVHLKHLIKHPIMTIKKECCWALSNITAGTKRQIEQVINEGFIPMLVQAMNEQEYEVRREALWAIVNLTHAGTPQQIDLVVSCGAIDPMVEILTLPDVRVQMVALEGLEKILESGDNIVKMQGGVNAYCNYLLHTGAVQVIEEVQESPHPELCTKAESLLRTYFDVDEVLVGEPLPESSEPEPPKEFAVNDVQQFNF